MKINVLVFGILLGVNLVSPAHAVSGGKAFRPVGDNLEGTYEDSDPSVGTIRVQVEYVGEPGNAPWQMKVSYKCAGSDVWQLPKEPIPICDFRLAKFDRGTKNLRLRYSTSEYAPEEAKGKGGALALPFNSPPCNRDSDDLICLRKLCNLGECRR